MHTKKSTLLSLLVDGYIPEKTDCPFKDGCIHKLEDNCIHRGKEHLVKFHCVIARALDNYY